MSPFDTEAFREITEHYIPSEDEDAREANLRLAAEMSANDIANKAVLNLNPGNRETFKQAMKLVHNREADISDCCKAVSQIAEIVNGDQAVKGG